MPCLRQKKTDGYVELTSLDEFWSHKFLESLGKTLTAVQFRNEFRAIDINSDKRMGFVEFLIWEYKVDVTNFLQRPQGGGGGEIQKAQDLLNQVTTAFNTAQAALDKATKTENEAKKSKEAAVKSEEAAKVAAEAARKTAADASAKAAEAAAAAGEQQAAVNDLKSQEDAYSAKTKELEAKCEAGGVSGMKAKNELAQHQAEDPLPLRKAKLSATAAAKKTEKAKQVADAASAAAETAKQAADAAAVAAEKDRIRAEEAAITAEKDRVSAEAAVEEGQKKLAEAEAYLEEQKAKGTGETHGTFWWLDRELKERKDHMPKTGKAKLLF